MKRTIWILTLALLPMMSQAQAAKLKMPDFSHLSEQATESVDISLEGDTLKSAGGFLGGGADNADMQDVLKDIDGIYVKVFSFDRPDVYSMRDVESVIDQTKEPGWKKLMSIRDGKERVEMWMREQQTGGGFLLVVTEPTEFVLVNIAGKVDLEKLRRLQGRMGMPNIPGLGSAPAATPAPQAAAPASPAPAR